MNRYSKLSLFIFVLFCLNGCAKLPYNSAENDASSFERALQVSKIEQEYDFAKKQCPDCQFLGQSLAFEKRKPYDLLTYQKPDGTRVVYYFDISKFYGKW